MATILPSVGTKGYYKIAPPFDSFINPAKLYTCHALRSLNDMVSSDDKPFETIYDANGIIRDKYIQDLENGVYIVVLLGDGDEWINVPNSYLLSYPILTGIPYQGKAITLPLGGIPTIQDLSAVNDLLAALVHDTLGIDTAVDVINTSSVVVVSDEEHNRLKTIRENLISVRRTDRSRYLEVSDSLSEALRVIEALECYIMTRCCGDNKEDLCAGVDECDLSDPLDIIINMKCGTSCKENINHPEKLYLYRASECETKYIPGSPWNDDKDNDPIDIILEKCKTPIITNPTRLFLACSDNCKNPDRLGVGIPKPPVEDPGVIEFLLGGCTSVPDIDATKYFLTDGCEGNVRPRKDYIVNIPDDNVIKIASGCARINNVDAVDYLIMSNID